MHGLYYNIPGTVTEFGGEKVKVEGDVEGVEGFKVGRNRRGTVYIGPRPVLGHGVHRYMFDVVALKEGIVWEGEEMLTKEDVGRLVKGKVLGWGRWMGTFERKWE